jgi:hypothetical protein
VCVGGVDVCVCVCVRLCVCGVGVWVCGWLRRVGGAECVCVCVCGGGEMVPIARFSTRTLALTSLV